MAGWTGLEKEFVPVATRAASGAYAEDRYFKLSGHGLFDGEIYLSTGIYLVDANGDTRLTAWASDRLIEESRPVVMGKYDMQPINCLLQPIAAVLFEAQQQAILHRRDIEACERSKTVPMDLDTLKLG